jgi:hypothetical protein
VKLGCFQPVRLKSNPVIKCIKHHCQLLIHHYLHHRAIMFGVTNHITHHLMIHLMAHHHKETSSIQFLKAQLLEEINNNFTLKLQATSLEVLISPYNIQDLSILLAINILHLQGLDISLKLRVKVYTLSIQVGMDKISLQEEIRIQEDCHHYITNQTQIRQRLTITVLAITLVVVTVLAAIPFNIPRATLIRMYMEVLEVLSSRLEAHSLLQK